MDQNAPGMASPATSADGLIVRENPQTFSLSTVPNKQQNSKPSGTSSIRPWAEGGIIQILGPDGVMYMY